MGKLSKVIDEIELHTAKDGKIEIAILKEPYGEGSLSVISIGIFLETKNEPDWKVHIPKDNIDSVIEALQKAKVLI